jgi:predicted polyphosphate/ATP-dependent NAD kinase
LVDEINPIGGRGGAIENRPSGGLIPETREKIIQLVQRMGEALNEPGYLFQNDDTVEGHLLNSKLIVLGLKRAGLRLGPSTTRKSLTDFANRHYEEFGIEKAIRIKKK